jgi:uncharacterized protein YndB with AHSA1/START domain
MEEIRVSSLIQASPNSIYAAWLDERRHGAFTGGRATVEPWVGGRHTAWDGYIEGILVELDTGRKIVMTWRTTEFPEDAPDSSVEVHLEPVAGGTKVTIAHTQIPDGQGAQYKDGWRTHYLDPMKKFFGKPERFFAAIRAAAQMKKAAPPKRAAAKTAKRAKKKAPSKKTPAKKKAPSKKKKTPAKAPRKPK